MSRKRLAEARPPAAASRSCPRRDLEERLGGRGRCADDKGLQPVDAAVFCPHQRDKDEVVGFASAPHFVSVFWRAFPVDWVKRAEQVLAEADDGAGPLLATSSP